MKKKKEVLNAEPARKKCSTCVYRTSNDYRGCNYIMVEGRRRGCPVEKCNKYRKGPRLKGEKTVPWSGQGIKEDDQLQCNGISKGILEETY